MKGKPVWRLSLDELSALAQPERRSPSQADVLTLDSSCEEACTGYEL